MKNQISLYQFIMSCLLFLAMIVGAWINFNIKIADLNARVVSLETTAKKIDRKVDKDTYANFTKEVNNRLENIQNGQKEIYQLLIKRN